MQVAPSQGDVDRMTENSKCKLNYKQYCFLLDSLQKVTKNSWDEDAVNHVFKDYFEVQQK